MKLTIPAKTLKGALGALSGVVVKTETVPILSHVKLVALNDQLTVTACDLERQLTVDIDCDLARAGALTVPGAMFASLIAKLPEKAEVALEQTATKDGDGRLAIRAGKVSATLPTLHAGDFPDVMEQAGAFDAEIRLGGEELADMLGTVRFAIGHDETRIYLCGAHLHPIPNGIRAVATDGHRLAMTDLECDTGNWQPATSLIIPRKTVDEMQKLAAHWDGEVRLALGPSRVILAAGRQRLASKLIDSTYPDYMRVVPQSEPKTRLTMPKAEAQASVDRVSTIQNERAAPLRLEVDSRGEIVLHASNKTWCSEARDEVSGEVEGSKVEIGFGARYLADILGAIEGDEVLVSLYGPGEPARFASPDSSAQFVLMPMRI